MPCGDGTGPLAMGFGLKRRISGGFGPGFGGGMGFGSSAGAYGRRRMGRNQGNGGGRRQLSGMGRCFDASLQNRQEFLRREAEYLETALEEINKQLNLMEEDAVKNGKPEGEKQQNA
jgi:hypothetical protein